MAHPDRLIRSQLRNRYTITTMTEETFQGVIIAADDRHVVIADASLIAPNGDSAKVDGDLWIPRPTIKYMQNA